ncbi:hypothetical protein [Nitrosopumilus sp.]|uniref:hypothetical protein n=1 Tax=Nitrosopumilus sp. TaxID=2024843 RepID=UPI0034A07AFA
MKQIEYVLMIGVALSGKTTYRKINFNYDEHYHILTTVGKRIGIHRVVSKKETYHG